MKFLVLLLTFVVQRKFNLTLSQKHDSWAFRLMDFLELKFPVVRHNTTLYLAIGIVLPAILLLILLAVVDDLLFGTVTLLVNFVILFLCLGCGYLKTVMDEYLNHWQAGRYQTAFETLASADIHIENVEELSQAELHHEVCLKYLYHTFQRYFTIIFWYMIAGPAGALVARLAHVSAVHPSVYRPGHVADLCFLLEWFPARLLGFSFALIGNFSGAVKQGLNYMIDPMMSARKVLQHCAFGSLDRMFPEIIAGDAQPEQDVEQMIALRELLNRALIVWFAVLAMLTIAGWLS